jgi:plastocyanin
MKKILPLIVFLAASTVNATIVTINNSGLTFSPANVTINQGDTVNFVISGTHDAREVSQSTYNANGNTALAGGFQTALGGGIVLPAQLTVGTHYYVCTPHASVGMKGTINVISTTGINFSSLLLGTPSVYPNPATDNFTVSFQLEKSASIKMRLSGMDGKTFLVEEIANVNAGEITHLFDLKGIKPNAGVYFVEILVNEQKFSQLLIVE